jgi:hypothetical protein
MTPSEHRSVLVAAFALLFGLFLAACSAKHVVVGSQCPSPHSGLAKYVGGDAGGAALFGTSCAPCGSGREKFDTHGCPIYVTFGSCGGDICLGDQIIRQPGVTGAEDGGDEGDAASAKGDSGAL